MQKVVLFLLKDIIFGCISFVNSFLNRLFVDGEYTFENGIEPPYINRNWLLHGKCCREIERFECIQLLNALETIENVLGNEKEIES